MKTRFLPIAGITFAAILGYLYIDHSNSPPSDQQNSTGPAVQDPRQGSTNAKNSNAINEGNPISLKECVALYENNQTESSLQKNKKYALTRFFRKLAAQKIDHTQQDIIGDMAGLSRREVSLAASGLNQSAFMEQQGKIVLLADDYQNKKELPSLERSQLDKAVSNKNYHEIVLSLIHI